VPMDTVHAPTPARSFALRLGVWSLGLAALIRLPGVGTHILLPVTQWQAAAGSALVGPSSVPIEATLACSGSDALALCLAAIAAYPASWRARARGMAGAAAAILALNTLRIGTLGRVAAWPRWFEALHLYVWPAVLIVAMAGFVFTWMRGDDRRSAADPVATRTPPAVDWRETRRFALVSAAALLVFTITSPLYLESARVLAAAGLVARAAAFLLRVLGVDATATASVLATPRGSYLVTQECILTPLIPVYLAAVFVYSGAWWRRAAWAIAGLPLFIGLAIARLLVGAVPAGLDASPVFFIHAFFQFLVGFGMVCGLALWRHGVRMATFVRVVAALALAIAFVRLLGSPYTHAIMSVGMATPVVGDPQGALMFLPAFQSGLFLALWVAAFVPHGWIRFLFGASLLAAMQIVVAGGVQFLASHAGIAPLVRDVRAWALVGPALIIATVIHVASPRR
jgi:exosortase/archaeosortase family protein